MTQKVVSVFLEAGLNSQEMPQDKEFNEINQLLEKGWRVKDKTTLLSSTDRGSFYKFVYILERQ